MILEHQGKAPHIHETAYVAPTATVCGDVSIGPHTCVLFDAVITAEGGPVNIGERCVVMENAVLRGTSKHPLTVGNHVLVGPRTYLTGCMVEDTVFLATGSTVFNGATIEAGTEVRINGTVHIETTLPEDSTVPIGWIAVGEHGELFPPDAHDQIWDRQKPLNFPMTVFGLDREPTAKLMPKLTARYTDFLKQHNADTEI